VFAPALNPSQNTAETPDVLAVMEAGIKQAHEAVADQIEDGGTTLTAVVLVDDLAYIAHVGDTRAYVVSGSAIEQITRDHSLVQRLIEVGQITPDEAAIHSRRNVLYRALGQSETIDVDTLARRLPPRSRLVVCSDGLWGLVSNDTIRDVVTGHDTREACRELVRLANEAGGPDNITVLIVQMPD
jgi:serine/threonine protein phosphatase PrpC